MDTVKFRPTDEMRTAADSAFLAQRGRIVSLLPNSTVQHVGATSIPGSLTKGDVDLLVGVDQTEFLEAVDALAAVYERHQLENWTSTYASFKDEAGPLPVGVQLVVGGSPEEQHFLEFRDLLCRDARLLDQYNRLKRNHDGVDPDSYVIAKAAFIENVLQNVQE
jgi:GrpB-like predicted nucleotidyltransferase (UPF0157 family)